MHLNQLRWVISVFWNYANAKKFPWERTQTVKTDHDFDRKLIKPQLGDQPASQVKKYSHINKRAKTYWVLHIKVNWQINGQINIWEKTDKSDILKNSTGGPKFVFITRETQHHRSTMSYWPNGSNRLVSFKNFGLYFKMYTKFVLRGVAVDNWKVNMCVNEDVIDESVR